MKWLIFVLLAIGGGTIFKAMYLREVFYYPWNEFMGLNNTESGYLMGWLGFVGIFAGVIAGPLIDKVNNSRLLLSVSFVAMGLVTLWQSTAPGLGTQYVIVGLLSFIGNGLFLISMVRATRFLGSSEEQGRLFGLLESGRGIAGTLLTTCAVGILSWATTDAMGIQMILRLYACIYITLGFVTWFLFPKGELGNSAAKGEEKFSMSKLLEVLRVRDIWLAAISVSAIIGVYQGASYLIPYLTDAYGLGTDTAGLIGMLRAYVLSFLVAPFAGILADKVGSAIKVMNRCFLFGAVCIGFFFVIPQRPDMIWILLLVVILVAGINFALRGIMYAQVDEIGIPVRYTGTAMGLVAFVGFSPEAFIHILFGTWLDAYGLAAYNYMFAFMCGAFIVGACCTFMLFKNKKKRQDAALVEAAI